MVENGEVKKEQSGNDYVSDDFWNSADEKFSSLLWMLNEESSLAEIPQSCLR